jgi:hypothetical protein
MLRERFDFGQRPIHGPIVAGPDFCGGVEDMDVTVPARVGFVLVHRSITRA